MPKYHELNGTVTKVERSDNPKAPVRVELTYSNGEDYDKTDAFKAWPTVGGFQGSPKKDNPAIPYLEEGAELTITYVNRKDKEGNWEKFIEDASQNGSSGAVSPQEASESNIRSTPPSNGLGSLEDLISGVQAFLDGASDALNELRSAVSSNGHGNAAALIAAAQEEGYAEKALTKRLKDLTGKDDLAAASDKELVAVGDSFGISV